MIGSILPLMTTPHSCNPVPRSGCPGLLQGLMYGRGLLPVRRDCLPLATRRFYSVFSTVVLMCLSCCLLLV